MAFASVMATTFEGRLYHNDSAAVASAAFDPSRQLLERQAPAQLVFGRSHARRDVFVDRAPLGAAVSGRLECDRDPHLAAQR